jgi:hypothetical protein
MKRLTVRISRTRKQKRKPEGEKGSLLKPEISNFGSRREIVAGIFVGRKNYLDAVKELENELYKVA